MKKLELLAFSLSILGVASPFDGIDASNQNTTPLLNGKGWYDTAGNRINCHGGNIIKSGDLYYWYGEHRPGFDSHMQRGVICYSSPDLINWTDEGIVFSTVGDTTSLLQHGCIIERPKVVYCPKTKKYNLWFHHELKGKGYAAAHAAVAESDSPKGPFRLIRSARVNPGKYPLNFDNSLRGKSYDYDQEWWTPAWRQDVEEGMIMQRDLPGGQMARDMTIFVDDDGTAYHIFSSEENGTLQIAELNKDYNKHTGRYIRIFPGDFNEAPVVFKHNGKYWMITSGCTGWAPNKARMFSADSMLGEWTRHDTPFIGDGSDVTFGGQGAFPLTVDGQVYFMADQWHPQCLADSRYMMLPIEYDISGKPEIAFTDIAPVLNSWRDGKKLVWHDEFDTDGPLDKKVWNYEEGFVRNHEAQWYQKENAYCKDGLLILEARKECRPNREFREDSSDWRKQREVIEYTSASVNTSGNMDFKYGTLEVRARIPSASGAWPAIWTLGTEMPWPSNGEIDVMEMYRVNGQPHILANVASGTDKDYTAKWNSKKIPLAYFTQKDSDWVSKFHIWRMDWDEDMIKIYLDDELINSIPTSETINSGKYSGTNGMQQPHYFLLDLALGGDNGGEIDPQSMPLRYEIDYVRLYQ